MDKSAIRKQYRDLRKTIPFEMQVGFSENISNRVIEFLNSNPAIRHVHLFLYITKLNEVNTFPLLEKLQGLGYIIYTSYLNPVTKELDTLEITHNKDFEPGDFGIPIPKESKKVDSHQIQLVFVPLLAYDIKGNRIGYGKAYYDIFLTKLHHETIKVGLSFFPPEKEIPSESHDIRLDFCVTPEEIYHFSHT